MRFIWVWLGKTIGYPLTIHFEASYLTMGPLLSRPPPVVDEPDATKIPVPSRLEFPGESRVSALLGLTQSHHPVPPGSG